MKARKEPPMRNEERLAILETTILNINTTLSDIKQQFVEINARFDKMDTRFDKIDARFNRFEDRLWSNFLWLMGMMLGLAGLIAHAHHWI